MKTDTELKMALAKLLPDVLELSTHEHDGYTKPVTTLCWQHRNPVLDTELLHVCWLVEETMFESQHHAYMEILAAMLDSGMYQINSTHAWFVSHATWQQRAAALCKVKGIEV
jgi:hypothetical protein